MSLKTIGQLVSTMGHTIASMVPTGSTKLQYVNKQPCSHVFSGHNTLVVSSIAHHQSSFCHAYKIAEDVTTNKFTLAIQAAMGIDGSVRCTKICSSCWNSTLWQFASGNARASAPRAVCAGPTTRH